ncbi:MAG: hypothetical protein K2H70_04210 [Bacteroidales bacterium]|nr:hypothetical protein [Bacteroidales bacterium]
MRNRLAWFLMAAMLTLSIGCSPARRFVRLVERHPHLVQDTTISIIDTVVLPGMIAIDTVFGLSADPVRIETPKLSASFGRGSGKEDSRTGTYREAFRRGDSLFWLQVDLKPDTVYVPHEVRVPVYRPTVTKKRFPWWVVPVTLGEVVVIFIFAKLR